MGQFEDDLASSYIQANDAAGDHYGENFNGGIVAKQNGSEVRVNIDPSRTYKDVEYEQRLNDLNERLNNDAEQRKREAYHAEIADAVGIGVGTLVGAVGAGTMDPFLIYGAPIAGGVAKRGMKQVLDPPQRASERDISGMNGQDFEGINNF